MQKETNTKTSNPQYVTNDNLKTILKEHTIVLLDFWALWCGPCKALSPIIETLVGEYQGRVFIGQVNVDEEQDLTEYYKIKSIPTLIFFKDGQEKTSLIGGISINEIRAKLDSLLS